MKNTTPKLRKETKVVKIHNDKLTDDYAWIKQDNWQEVLQKPQVLNSEVLHYFCLLYTSPSPRDVEESRMPSSA